MSVLSRLESMGEDVTELNLDGISKPDLKQIKPKADTLTELSLNLCKLSSLSDLPDMPSLYKLHLNDNNLTDVAEIAEKCPGLLELSLSGNKKIATIDQLKAITNFKTLMRLDLEGCALAEEEGYRKKVFALSSNLACIDNLDSQGNEVPDDDDEEDEEIEEESESEDEKPGLSALYQGDLPSDESDDDYNSNEEPEGSDGEDDSDVGEPEQTGYNDAGAGPSSSGAGPSGSGRSSGGPPPKRAKVQDSDSDSD